MIQHLSRQLFQLSAPERIISANAVEELGTNLMPELSVVRNSPHKVLEEIWISSIHYMVMNQMNQQESGTVNLHKITSNTGPLLPKPTL